MGAGVLRVHRRDADWLPGRVALGDRVAVTIAVADRRNWPPELICIFGVEYGDHRVGCGHRDERHEPGAVEHIQSFGDDDLTWQCVGGARADKQPEMRIFGLSARALRTVARAELFDLVVVPRPI